MTRWCHKWSKVSKFRTPTGAIDDRKKKEHKLKLSGPDIFRWGGGLPPAGGWGEKELASFPRNPGKLLFLGREIPRFWLGYPGGDRKVLRKKQSRVQLLAPKLLFGP